MAALTLAQHALASQDPLIAKVVQSFHESGSVLQDIPFETMPYLNVKGVRFTEAGLPTPGYRKINEAATSVSATPEQVAEQAFILANDIDVDKVLVEDAAALTDPRWSQLMAYLQAVSKQQNDYFINNNHVTGDADAAVGLRARLDNPTTYGLYSGMKINAGGVDMSADATAADVFAFLEQVDLMLYEMGVPEGDGVTLYMSELMKVRFDNKVKQLGAGGGFNMAQDAFGRSVSMYKNAKVRAIGRKVASGAASASVITNTETAGGADGSSTFTSLYAVRYGQDAFTGWQMHPLEVIDHGLYGGTRNYRLSLEWPHGYLNMGNRSVARLYNVDLTS